MTPKKYHKNIIISHWLTALLILIVFPIGLKINDSKGSVRVVLLVIHAVLGIAIFGITLVRSWMSLKYPRPLPVNTGSQINNLLIVFVHKTFYLTLLGLCVSGILVLLKKRYYQYIFQKQEILTITEEKLVLLEYHENFSKIFVLLFLVHVIGVIKHYILKKENTLKRIR